MVPPTKVQIKAVLEFLEYFENPEGKFYEIDTGKTLLDPYVYSEKIMAFIQALYQNNFIMSFDWKAWQAEARKYVEDDGSLAEADLETIMKLFTTLLRKDRFVSGHLAEMIEKGHIMKLLKRLEEITNGP